MRMNLGRLALLTLLAAASRAAAEPIDGIFSALWFTKADRIAHEAQFGPWLYHNFYEDEQGLHNVEYWKKEVADMDRAKFRFIAPYSFGKEVSPASDPVNFKALARAIIESKSPLRIAYFQDTSGLPITSTRDTGVPLPFDLSKGEAHWKRFMYDENVRRYFDAVPREVQYKYRGRPLMFFYTSNFIIHKELLGKLLIKIRAWYKEDYGADPYIIVDQDWSEGQTQLVKNEVAANSDGFFSWSFMASNGEGPFPGGGVVRKHPRTGVSVGAAGVGYSYSGDGQKRFRDRRNGQTLKDDWGKIKGADIRMVAAWMDLEEASGICRTKEYGYQYIDIMTKLICPACEISVCLPETHAAPHWGTRDGKCLRSCGAVGGTKVTDGPCENHDMVTAGSAYDTEFCCREAAASQASSLRRAPASVVPAPARAEPESAPDQPADAQPEPEGGD